jgi:hypothetical protein
MFQPHVVKALYSVNVWPREMIYVLELDAGSMQQS